MDSLDQEKERNKVKNESNINEKYKQAIENIAYGIETLKGTVGGFGGEVPEHAMVHIIATAAQIWGAVSSQQERSMGFCAASPSDFMQMMMGNMANANRKPEETPANETPAPAEQNPEAKIDPASVADQLLSELPPLESTDKTAPE